MDELSADLGGTAPYKVNIDLYIPGCPVHPLTFINALLAFIR